MKYKSGLDLDHPGFVLFEGVDITGKSIVSRTLVRKLWNKLGLRAQYNHNKGFLDESLVDPTHIEEMNSAEKTEYILRCYQEDSLPTEPREFVEILQDRHVPSIAFYSVIMDNVGLEQMQPYVDNTIKPKHIILLEADYNTRVERVQGRSSVTQLEKIGLTSPKANLHFLDMYRRVVEMLNVPYTVIDTSDLTVDEAANECLDTFVKAGVLLQDVSVDSLVVEYEPRVYPSTADRRLQELNGGKSLKPIKVTRKIDANNMYVDVVEDGRHRAYAAWIGKQPSIKAYVNVDPVDSVTQMKTWGFDEFGFK